MEKVREKIHFADNYLISPTNPIQVNLIGAGGTGSKVLTALLEMNHTLMALNHPGLSVRLWDDDIITESNLGRQRFAESETGLHKSVALINRANRWAGTDWKAETAKFEKGGWGNLPEQATANIYLSCVDTVTARFGIAEILDELKSRRSYRNSPLYWMDFGNSLSSGQVILSTIGNIKQPQSEKFETVDHLPYITEEFGDLLEQSEETDNVPSCSVAEAIGKQDLYINSALAQMGCSLLWGLFRNGLTPHRGFFLNLKDFRSQPIPV